MKLLYETGPQHTGWAAMEMTLLFLSNSVIIYLPWLPLALFSHFDVKISIKWSNS